MAPLKFQRIDGEVSDLILDADKEKNVLDADGKSQAALIADFIRTGLGKDDVDVEAKSLAGSSVPAFISIDEQTRRMRDYLSLTQKNLPKDLLGKRTFVVNTNSPLVENLYAMRTTNPDLAKEMIEQLFELSLLGQRELAGEHLSGFISRTSKLLQTLSERI